MYAISIFLMEQAYNQYVSYAEPYSYFYHNIYNYVY
jgi:hypothetical protein